LAIIRLLGRACGVVGLIGGQALDLAALRQPRSISARRWRQIAERKTGALMTASVMAGGLAGGADAMALGRLRRFGRHLGVAFQLVDDLQDQDGVVRIRGPQLVRAEAQRALHRAISALAPFGSRAAILRQLAADVAARATAVAHVASPSGAWRRRRAQPIPRAGPRRGPRGSTSRPVTP
jgi:farnesyl diphosphate synthase